MIIIESIKLMHQLGCPSLEHVVVDRAETFTSETSVVSNHTRWIGTLLKHQPKSFLSDDDPRNSKNASHF